MSEFIDGQNLDIENPNGSFYTAGLAAHNSYQHINTNFTLEIAHDSDSVDVSDTVATADSFTSYFVRIYDQHGKEAYGYIAPAAPSTPVTIDVSALRKTDDWGFDYVLKKGVNGSTLIITQKNQTVVKGDKQDQTASISDNQAAGTLNIQVYGEEDGVETFAKATVADAGTAAFGASALDSDVYAFIYLQNTSTQYPLTVTAVTLGGSFVAGGTKATPQPFIIIPEGENAVLKVKIRTSVAALTTATVTVTNNTTNVSYAISITTTPA